MKKLSHGQFNLAGILSVVAIAVIAIGLFIFFITQLKPPGKPPVAAVDFKDPTQAQIQQVSDIYNTMHKPLPSGTDWKIDYGPMGTLANTFKVTVDTDNFDAYKKAVEESFNSFRQSRHEPCSSPLAGLIFVIPTKNFYTGPPSPGTKVWEPCE